MVLRKNENVIVRQEGSEYLFFNPSTDTLAIANEATFAIWNACDSVQLETILDGIRTSLSDEHVKAAEKTIRELISLGFLLEAQYGKSTK